MEKSIRYRISPAGAKMIMNFNFRMLSSPFVIVCHCHAVNDRAIRQAVRQGACSLRQVALLCQAGRRCGGCRPAVRQVIDEELGSAPGVETTPGAVAAS